MQKSDIQVIRKAVIVLRACAETNRGLSLGDIAERVAMPRSTVQRIVNSLRAEDLLSSEDSYRSIRLGSGLFALTSRPHLDVVEIAHPFLKSLAQETGETVDLAMLRNDHLVFVDQVAGSHRLRAVSSVGETFPLHNSANGKAVLAVLSDNEIKMKLGGTLDRFKPGAQKFLADIDAIRITGVAEDRQEHTEGISAIGTAFRVVSGIYALSIPMPSIRFDAKRAQLEHQVIAARDNILMAIKAANA